MSGSEPGNPGASSVSKQMTDVERLALCHKLDQELDDFINGLEKKKYTDGWSEDRWEEQMDQHPFFMKTAPADGELSPLAEGLAKLKYDPDENSPLELATNYKEDGNFNFKHKNYRLAILGYTEGIKVKSGDPEIESALYNNRAAAHWHLKNYRSALQDSETAIKFKPDHMKAILRAAKSAYAISKYETTIQHCNQYLKLSSNPEVTELLNNAQKKKQLQDRDKRKKERVVAKNNEQKDLVIKAIIERGIKISNCDDADDIELSKLEPCLPGSDNSIVKIENGVLKWPVLFMYPEYQMTDFVKDCPENVALTNQLEQLFPAPWDKNDKYAVSKVNVYYEGYDRMPHVLNISLNLKDILVDKYFELKAGTPAFFVLPRGSVVERNFLESYL